MNNLKNVNVNDLASLEVLLADENTIDISMRIDTETGKVDFYRVFRKYDNGRIQTRLHDDIEQLEINSLLNFLKDNNFYNVTITKRVYGFNVLAQSVGLYENYFSYDYDTVKEALENAKRLPVFGK